MKKIKRKALGKGLSALISETLEEEKEKIEEIDIKFLKPNPYQPRLQIDNIDSLANSIKEKGILNPILVTKEKDYYEIIAGERRYKAALKAGLKKVPVIVMKIKDNEKLEIALIENLQRENLNPIEEGMAYKFLIEKFNLTHEEIGKRIGKDRSTITNTLRLLSLPKEIQLDVSRETISESHARCILALENPTQQLKIAEKIKKESLSVRETERLVKRIIKGKIKRNDKNNILSEIAENLKKRLKTKVSILGSDTKGKILIYYFSKLELERLLELFYNL